MIKLILLLATVSTTTPNPCDATQLDMEYLREVFQSQIYEFRGDDAKVKHYHTKVCVTVVVGSKRLSVLKNEGGVRTPKQNKFLNLLCKEKAADILNPVAYKGYRWGFYQYPEVKSLKVIGTDRASETSDMMYCKVVGNAIMRNQN